MDEQLWKQIPTVHCPQCLILRAKEKKIKKLKNKLTSSEDCVTWESTSAIFNNVTCVDLKEFPGHIRIENKFQLWAAFLSQYDWRGHKQSAEEGMSMKCINSYPMSISSYIIHTICVCCFLFAKASEVQQQPSAAVSFHVKSKIRICSITHNHLFQEPEDHSLQLKEPVPPKERWAH